MKLNITINHNTGSRLHCLHYITELGKRRTEEIVAHFFQYNPSRLGVDLLRVLLQLHLELPGLDPELGGAVPPVGRGRTARPGAGGRRPQQRGVVRGPGQVGVGSVGGERGED